MNYLEEWKFSAQFNYSYPAGSKILYYTFRRADLSARETEMWLMVCYSVRYAFSVSSCGALIKFTVITPLVSIKSVICLECNELAKVYTDSAADGFPKTIQKLV